MSITGMIQYFWEQGDWAALFFCALGFAAFVMVVSTLSVLLANAVMGEDK